MRVDLLQTYIYIDVITQAYNLLIDLTVLYLSIFRYVDV